MHACMYECRCMYNCMYVYIYMYVWIMPVCVSIYVCLYYVCIMCVCVCVCARVCVCACVCVCVCVCRSVCKEEKRHCQLNEEALDLSVWRTRFGKGYGPVVRQTAEWWMNEVGTYVRLVYTGIRMRLWQDPVSLCTLHSLYMLASIHNSVCTGLYEE
jgi:Flp pilus assembly protein TadB